MIKHTAVPKQPVYLSWPDRQQLAEEYKAGAGAYGLAFRSGHTFRAVKAWLQSLGIYRTRVQVAVLRGQTQRARRTGEPYDSALPTVVPPQMVELEGIAPRLSRGLCNFRPMLHVDIATGEVLLDRRAEVMGSIFGTYSQASAFNERS